MTNPLANLTLPTDAEKVSIVAIYKVIKQGIQIGEHGNHKDRGKHTITLAAPVLINGTRANVAVVVQKLGKYKYHAHRILLPEGAVFVLKNKDAESRTASMPTNEGRQGLPNDSASTIIIPNSQEKVNPSSKFSSLMETKKTEVVKTPAANADPEVSRSVTYSIAQIIEFVNSGDLLRYSILRRFASLLPFCETENFSAS